METGDRSDIQKRVQEHDNRHFNLIKDVCKFYGITDYDFFEQSRRQPGTKARQLAIFVMIRNLGMKYCAVAGIVGSSTSYVSQVVRYWDKRLKKEIIRQKFSSVINNY